MGSALPVLPTVRANRPAPTGLRGAHRPRAPAPGGPGQERSPLRNYITLGSRSSDADTEGRGAGGKTCRAPCPPPRVRLTRGSWGEWRQSLCALPRRGGGTDCEGHSRLGSQTVARGAGPPPGLLCRPVGKVGALKRKVPEKSKSPHTGQARKGEPHSACEKGGWQGAASGAALNTAKRPAASPGADSPTSSQNGRCKKKGWPITGEGLTAGGRGWPTHPMSSRNFWPLRPITGRMEGAAFDWEGVSPRHFPPWPS